MSKIDEMRKRVALNQIVAALNGWRHWVGNDMLNHLDVEDSEGTRDVKFRARLEIADPNAIDCMQEFFEIGPYRKEYATWSGPGLKLFVSHVTVAKEKAGLLADALKAYGIVPFLAHEDIEPMDHWPSVLLAALNSMDALLSFHSEGFIASKYCNQEVGFALGRDIPVVPIMAGEMPAGFIDTTQGIKWSEATNAYVADSVVTGLLKNTGTKYVLGEAFARDLKFAGSWAAAGRSIDLLGKCGPLTDRARRNIELALLLNDQVRNNENAEALLSDTEPPRHSRRR